MKKAALTILFFLSLISSAFAAFDSFEDLVAAEEKKEAGVPAQASDNVYEAAKKETEILKKSLIFKQDKVEGVTWIHTNLAGYSYLDIYAGERGANLWLRLRAHPKGSSKELATEQIIINIDGAIHRLDVTPSDRNITVKSSLTEESIITKSKSVSHFYKERIDIRLSQDMVTMLEDIVKSEHTLVRLRGKYNDDFELSKTGKNHFGILLRYYRARQLVLAGPAAASSGTGHFVEIGENHNGKLLLDINSIKDGGSYIYANTKFVQKGIALEKGKKMFGNDFVYFIMEKVYDKKERQIQVLRAIYYSDSGNILNIFEFGYSPDKYEKLYNDDIIFSVDYDRVMTEARKKGFLDD